MLYSRKWINCGGTKFEQHQPHELKLSNSLQVSMTTNKANLGKSHVSTCPIVQLQTLIHQLKNNSLFQNKDLAMVGCSFDLIHTRSWPSDWWHLCSLKLEQRLEKVRYFQTHKMILLMTEPSKLSQLSLSSFHGF